MEATDAAGYHADEDYYTQLFNCTFLPPAADAPDYFGDTTFMTSCDSRWRRHHSVVTSRLVMTSHSRRSRMSIVELVASCINIQPHSCHSIDFIYY